MAPAELRTRRRALGLTQAALAALLDVSTNTLARWERGELRVGNPRRIVRHLERLERQKPVRPPAPEAHPTVVRLQKARSIADRVALQTDQTHTLPSELSSFVGREAEIRDLRGLLGTTRLLTLTGTGGVGKTRLALALLRGVSTDSRMETAFVDLAPLADPALVPQTVSSALGVREQPGRTFLETLIDALRTKQQLLVLDNCEHLIQACAVFSDGLLRACPHLRIVATSRERLGINGEIVWRVPSLAVPESRMAQEQIENTEAVRLFVERARALMPMLELRGQTLRAVADVCRRLDGIPLALELAAAHMPVLSVEQIASRLDDALAFLTRGSRLAPERQQTVRATLDWSYRLLTEPEQLLLDRLAVFAGGWTLEAAEAVTGADGLESPRVLPLLGQLVDKSLVVAERNPEGLVRYRLLEVVHQAALERLAAGGLMQCIQDRHASYFLALAEQTQPELMGHGHLAAQARLEREHDNCRAALRRLVEGADTEVAQRLVGALGRFWFFRGYLAEGEAWTERVLSLPNAYRPTASRARCLFGSARLALSRGDYAAAEHGAQGARALWVEIGDDTEEGFSLFLLGFVARTRGDFPMARALLEHGVQLSRTAGDGAAEANCLWSLAELAYDQGDDREARDWAETALRRATEVGWPIGVTVAQRVLGAVQLRKGEYAAAGELLEASLAEARAMGAPWWIAETATQLGQLALEQRDLAQAGAWLAESLALARDLLDRAGLARALEGIAQLAAVQRAPRHALQLAGSAAALRESMRAPLAHRELLRLQRRLAPARRILGESAADAAWAKGRSLSQQQAIDLAVATAQSEPRTRAARTGSGGLTARELAVTRLVAQGMTNRQIADSLVIAEGTAERHVGNILAKLDMSARSQIAAWAVSQHLARQDTAY